MIGDSIEVTVLYISQHQVKLGIKAPDDVEIDRLEVRLRKDAERQRQE
jgi:carbon storage regulator CsrA